MKFWDLKYDLLFEQLMVGILFIFYLNGFLNIKSLDLSDKTSTISILTSQERDNIEKSIASQRKNLPIEKVVIMVIDALRADHLVTDELMRMNYSNGLLESGLARGFLLQTAIPTVTLPRIKSIVTGSIPAFIDVILNFGSASLEEENLIHSWTNAKKKVNFYGDETWLRLFPQSFHKQHAVTSLFVTDFTEVDNNVTFHLNQDLVEKDWDVLILHYLGLDHIGHIEDPKSPLMKLKLKEMDSIIEKIHCILCSEDEPYTIFVCGDHGMGDAGGHGGSSYSEVMSSLMVISNMFEERFSPFNRIRPTIIHQVDLASTLALLTGIEVPPGNIGKPIRGIMKYLTIEKQFEAYYKTSKQLIGIFENDSSVKISDEAAQLCKDAMTLHAHILDLDNKGEENSDWDGLDGVRSMSWSHRDSQNYTDVRQKALFLYDKCCDALSILLKERKKSYDMNLLGNSTLLCFIILFVRSFTMALKGPFSERRRIMQWIFIPITLLFFQAFNIFYIFILAVFLFNFHTLFSLVESFWHRFFPHKISLWSVFVLFFFLHPLSYISTSFVEEEHQTHYFIVSVTHFLLFAAILKKIYRTKSSIDKKSNETSISRRNYFFPILKHFLQTFFYNFHKMIQGSIIDLPNSGFFQLSLVIIGWFIFRILRSFNATGDKWKHLIDINDITRQIGPSAISLSAMIGCFISFYLFYSCGPILVFFIVTAIYHRHSFNLDQPKLGVFEAQITYVLLFLLIVKGILRITRLKLASSGNFSPKVAISTLFRYILATLSLLLLLLQKPENILATSLSFLQLRIFVPLILSEAKTPAATTTTLVNFVPFIILWLGRAHFFAQGNSNSLTTVQVGVGFIGVSHYNPIIHGTLIAFHTFGPKLLVLLYHLWASSQEQNQSCRNILELWWLYHLLILSIYMLNTLVQRHHLFIWSVLAPKLLYEGCEIILFIIMSIFSHCFQWIFSFINKQTYLKEA